jgi:hypothetical protein
VLIFLAAERARDLLDSDGHENNTSSHIGVFIKHDAPRDSHRMFLQIILKLGPYIDVISPEAGVFSASL